MVNDINSSEFLGNENNMDIEFIKNNTSEIIDKASPDALLILNDNSILNEEEKEKNNSKKNQEKLEKPQEIIDDMEINEVLKNANKVNFNVYGGLLVGTKFFTNKDKIGTSSNFSNLRVGGSANIPITKWMKGNVAGALDHDTGQTNNLTAAGVNFQVGKKIQMGAGKIPTPTGLNHRPPFLSGDGQFETVTQSRASGIKHGLSSKYSFGGEKDANNISAGAFLIDGNTEFHLAGKYKGVKASVWKNEAHKKPGAALTLEHKGIQSDFVFDQDDFEKDILSNSNFIPISKEKKLTAVTDIGYNITDGKFSHTEVGISKKFFKEISGEVLVSYNPINKTANVYLFLHNIFESKKKIIILG